MHERYYELYKYQCCWFAHTVFESLQILHRRLPPFDSIELGILAHYYRMVAIKGNIPNIVGVIFTKQRV